jgi:two-component system sensor histidine kinase PilS (NtrC family)
MFEDAIRRLRTLIFARALVITLLLGSFYIFQIGNVQHISPSIFSYFIVILYFLTIVYAVSLRWIKTLTLAAIFAYIQIVLDVCTEVFLVYLTGGIESWFSFTFLLSIISASIVLNRRASYYTASLSSILYGVLIEFQFYYDLPISLVTVFSAKHYLFNVFAHIIAFYLTAFLSGHLSQRLHAATQTLQTKDTYIDNLKALSRDIIESMPSGVLTTDLNWEIATFNSTAQRITGYDYTEVMGKTPQDIFPFIENINLKETFERTEGEIHNKGRTIPIGIRFTTIKSSSDTIIGIMGIFQDLTKLKAMEAEMRKKEKLAFIGELSALIAHELRNPLASLKASIEMLNEKRVSQQQADRLMKIALSEMDRLNEVVTDFLLYAKPQQPSKEIFDLHQSLRDVVTLLRSTKTDRENVRISEDFKGELFITGDSKQLQQVFWNLGINAVDAISDGGNCIVSTEKKDSTVEIIFKDNGKGISKEDIDKIFFPFFTTKEKGTGLGLSIAQRITEEHGGKVAVESQGIGNGTTFRVILPAENVKDEGDNEQVNG